MSVIVILATVAVPNYLGNRMLANEGAAVATLRSVLSAQAAFQGASLIDLDRDGLSEFGTLNEMAGEAPLPSGDVVRPPYLPKSLAIPAGQSRVLKSGYYFQLYLPDQAGLGVSDPTNARNGVEANGSELHWCIVAWPVRHGQTGRHTYFTNERGDIVKTRSNLYSGTANVPPAGCALIGNTSPDHIIGTSVAADANGADGEYWTSAR